MFKKLLLISVLVLGMLTFMTAEGQAWTKGGVCFKCSPDLTEWGRSDATQVIKLDEVAFPPSHLQFMAGIIAPDGSYCEDNFDENGNYIGGCGLSIFYYCLSKDCVDADGNVNYQKKKCLNQIASGPSAHVADDFVGFAYYSEDECTKNHNCKVTYSESYISLDNLSGLVDCPSGLVAGDVKPGDFRLYHRYCQGGAAGEPDGTNDYYECCRTDERSDDGECVDIYGDYCKVRLVPNGDGTYNCPATDGTSNYDPDDNVIRVLIQDCLGGDALVAGEEATCADYLYYPPGPYAQGDVCDDGDCP